ncbi:MAG: alpha/beta fold hydrolase [Caldilineaceae bacterium]
MRRFVKVLLWVALILLLLLILVPLVVPVPPLEGVSPVETLAEPDSTFVQVPLGDASLNVHVKQMGEGEPALILLHGFGASTFSWRALQDDLAQTHRTVAFDRPAFGLTERPVRGQWGDAETWSTANPYAPAAQSELVVNLMDELGIERAVLVGNSAGGTVAVNTALAHPDRVEALVLLSPAIYAGGGSPAWVRPLLQTPQAARLGPLLARRIQQWGLDFAASAWHDPSLIDESVWEGYRRPLLAENWDVGLWELTRASRASGLESRLNELTLPVLVLTGDDDRIVPTADSVRLAGELPNAELVVVPNCGHVPHEECPDATLAAINSFLVGIAKESE